MPHEEKRQEIIEQVVTEQLAPAHIVKVMVEEDLDHDGDEILRVRIVFEAEDDKLDTDKVLGLIRHLERGLEKIKEERFPIPYFMTLDEFNDAAA